MPNQKKDLDDLKELLDQENPKRKRRMGVMVLVVLLALAAGGLWFWWTPSGASTQVNFRTNTVSQGDLQVLVSATGTLEPVVQVDVGTEVSGTIQTIKVDFNDPVRKGQVLAVLDTTKLEAQREQAAASLGVSEAELKSAQAGASEARIDLERLNKAYKLSKGRLPSRQDLDAAQAAFDKAQAQVSLYEASLRKAAASLKAYETDLQKAVIKSPIDGMVLNRKVEPGQTVAASLEAPVLFVLAENLANMKLCVSVDEADVGQIAEGQKATFVVDAYPDRRFPAHITQVRYAPQEEDGVVTYDCILEVNNSELLLRPGMTATADIVTVEVKDATLVPNVALRFKPQASDARGQAVEKNSGGNILSKIMPRPPRRNKERKAGGNGTSSPKSETASKGTVWVLQNNQPLAVPVGLGPNDGLKTQIVAGGLRPGQQVIIGQETLAK